MTTKKGADPSVILEILMSMELSNLNGEQFVTSDFVPLFF